MKFGLKKEDRKFQDSEDLAIVDKSLPIKDTQTQFSPWDFIRCVNVRGESEFMATDGEKVIVGHRGSPLLGNRHVMQNKTMSERERVIAENKKDLEEDLERKGPKYQLFQKIARDIVENHTKYAISCFCSPQKCHTDDYVLTIGYMAEEMLKDFKKKVLKK